MDNVPHELADNGRVGKRLGVLPLTAILISC